jgi:hypothetical protein
VTFSPVQGQTGFLDNKKRAEKGYKTIKKAKNGLNSICSGQQKKVFGWVGFCLWGLEVCLRGEGRAFKINGSPSLSTQPIVSRFVFGFSSG